MPDIFTHIIHGMESLKEIGKEERNIILNSEKYFYLGCMGPDIFLYYSYPPWLKSRLIIGLGKQLHNRHCGELIAEAFKFINERKPCKGSLEDSSIYFLGYLCHYALDRTAHPFIFSRSGRYDRNRKETRKYITSHKITELAIDCHIAKLFGSESIGKLKLYKSIDIGKRMPYSIQNVYFHVLNKFFGCDTNKYGSKFINRSYLSFKGAWKLFYDPYNIKKYIFKALGLDFLFHPMNPYLRDYLNEGGEEWPDPCTGNPDSRSFHQVFDDSVKLAAELLNTCVGYLKGEVSYECMAEKIGNFSFLTNTDISETVQQMMYFKPIF